MFAGRRIAREDVAALERIEALVRARYRLEETALVIVTGEMGAAPGIPERLTRILFWPAPTLRHRVTVFKPPAEVVADDLPPGWLRSVLRDDGGEECC